MMLTWVCNRCGNDDPDCFHTQWFGDGSTETYCELCGSSDTAPTDVDYWWDGDENYYEEEDDS